ncbi:MAG TPA: hypothetical protein VFC78_02840 [Tepidisphaeraceae bacterium]|nr:hypothetical protein [Tepidisphaeraceae bacterium]
MSDRYYIDCAAVLSQKQDRMFRSLGRRFLALSQRSKVLSKALSEPPADNPLSLVKFHSPLSVAGQPSSIIVRAERLKMRGMPVALELDDRGVHRGEPLWRLAEKLQRALGRPVRDTEILEWYERWVGRSSRIAKRLERASAEIRRLTPALNDAVAAMCGIRFALVMEADGLAEAVTICTLAMVKNRQERESIVIGFDGTSLRLNGGVSAACHGVRGAGGAVVKTIDLYRAISAAKTGDALYLVFNRKRWDIEIVRNGSSISNQRFAYYSRVTGGGSQHAHGIGGLT